MVEKIVEALKYTLRHFTLLSTFIFVMGGLMLILLGYLLKKSLDLARRIDRFQRQLEDED